MHFVSIKLSRPAGRGQGFPIVLDLRLHAAVGFVVLLEIGIN